MDITKFSCCTLQDYIRLTNSAFYGFSCVCQQGFHGTLCQLRTTACEFSLDLCGAAGYCIPTQPDPESNEVGVKQFAFEILCIWIKS